MGTDYAYNTYGAQFAIPRKTANPTLSIRYLDDAGSWGGWTGITASALTSGDKTISGNLTITGRTYCNGGLNIAVNNWVYDSDGRQRFFYGNNGTSYHQGYNANGYYNHEFRNSVGSVTMGIREEGIWMLKVL